MKPPAPKPYVRTAIRLFRLYTELAPYFSAEPLSLSRHMPLFLEICDQLDKEGHIKKGTVRELKRKHDGTRLMVVVNPSPASS